MTEFQEMKQQKEYFEKQYEETLSQYNQMEEAVSSQQILFPLIFCSIFTELKFWFNYMLVWIFNFKIWISDAQPGIT